jgi:hypothetical protein
MGQQSNQGHLSNIGTFTRHVWASYQENLGVLMMQIAIIGNKWLIQFQRFEDGMTPIANDERMTGRTSGLSLLRSEKVRPTVAPDVSDLCQTSKNVQKPDCFRRFLYRWTVITNR